MSTEHEYRTDPKLNLRFEYAWRWFEFHSRQRVSMFNFFLIGIGILGNAYVLVLNSGRGGVAGSLAIVGALMALDFVVLDRRNRQLVKLGEQMLRIFECDELYRYPVPGSGPTGPLQTERTAGEPTFCLKHWFLIESFEAVAGIAFAIGAIYAFMGN